MSVKVLAGFVLALLLLPAIDGLIAKKVIIQNINAFNLESAARGYSINLVEYSSGWISSSVTLSVSPTAGGHQPEVMPPITIYHGPIVFIQRKPQIALASLNIDIKFPEELKMYVKTQSTYALRYHAVLSMDMHTIRDNLIIADMSMPDGTLAWGGMSMVNEITFSDNYLSSVSSKWLIGYLTLMSLPDVIELPNLQTDTITIDIASRRTPGGLWLGKVEMGTPSITRVNSTGSTETDRDVATHASIENEGSNYHINYKIKAGSIVIESSPYPVNNLKNAKFEFGIKNLTEQAIFELQNDNDDSGSNNNASLTMQDYQKLFNQFMKSITPATSLHMLAEADTNLGPFKLDANISLQSLPKSPDEFIKNMDVNTHIKAPAVLVEMFLAKIIADEQQRIRSQFDESAALEQNNAYDQSVAVNQPKPAAPVFKDPNQVAKSIVEKLLQDGYLTSDKSDYTITLIKKSDKTTINGKDVSDLMRDPVSAVGAIMSSIEIQNPPVSASTPAVEAATVPANPAAAQPVPATEPLSVPVTPSAPDVVQ